MAPQWFHQAQLISLQFDSSRALELCRHNSPWRLQPFNGIDIHTSLLVYQQLTKNVNLIKRLQPPGTNVQF